MVGVAVRTLETWRRIGVGPVWWRTESGFIRYHRTDIEHYLAAHGPGARSTGGRPRTRGCGTDAGYRWHRRHDEDPCHACRVAHRTDGAA